MIPLVAPDTEGATREIATGRPLPPVHRVTPRRPRRDGGHTAFVRPVWFESFADVIRSSRSFLAETWALQDLELRRRLTFVRRRLIQILRGSVSPLVVRLAAETWALQDLNPRQLGPKPSTLSKLS